MEIRMTYSLLGSVLVSACCASLACAGGFGTQRIGQACEYRQITGRATITDVRKADPGANNCDDAVEVIFTFMADDPSAPDRYLFADHPDVGRYVRVGAGLNPPRTWARQRGLVKGTVHRCIRSEIQKGVCTPVIFTFPDIDMKGWEKSCFESLHTP
jgi:hypothetical protein